MTATLIDSINVHTRHRGSAPAICESTGALTWSELGKRSSQVAHALLGQGIQPGERAAILAGTSCEYIIALLGILKAGLSAVPISTMIQPESVAHLLKDSNSVLLFTDQQGMARLSERSCSETCRTVLLDAVEGNGNSLPEWLHSLPDSNPDVQIDGADEFNVIYSSGTTGNPKGIVHDHHFRMLQVEGLKAIGLASDSLTVLTTAIYTNYSLLALLATLAMGGSVYLMPRFDEAEFLYLCRLGKPTHAFLVPVQINRLLEHEDFDRSLEASEMVLISAGSPLSLATKREVLDRHKGLLLEIYGATEGGASSVLVANAHPEKLASVGKPPEGTDVRIISEQNVELDVGEIGEIVGRSATMMRRYLNQADHTSDLQWKSPQGNSFYRSGDIGYIDEDGFLYLSDRKKDVIISNGMNVYAIDIEAVLSAHEKVVDCAVVGVPSQRRGEAPVAVVTPVDEDAPSEDVLLDWLNSRLGVHQRVAAIIFRSNLPRNAMGKITKAELRKEIKNTQQYK